LSTVFNRRKLNFSCPSNDARVEVIGFLYLIRYSYALKNHLQIELSQASQNDNPFYQGHIVYLIGIKMM
jgi:hypothetical protein